MSWNIKTPGDYINGPLTVAGNVGIGTTTFTSIAGYTSLKINNATNGAILDLAQGDAYKGRIIGSLNGLILESAVGLPVQIQVGGLNSFKADPAGVFIWYDGAGGVNQRMQLNSTGLAIGTTPELKLRVNGPDEAPATSGTSTSNGALRIGGANTNLCIDSGVCTTGGIYGWFQSRDRSTYASNYDLVLQKNGGNVGIGVVPIGGKGCLQLSSGINFPATQVASTDANTLDDYEEGTFTPAISGTSVAGAGTYSNQIGRYTKVGNQVTVWIRLSWSAHTGSGDMTISGLPFALSNVNNLGAAAAIGYTANISITAGNYLMVYGDSGNSRAYLWQTPTGGGSTPTVAMDPSGDIGVTMTYFI